MRVTKYKTKLTEDVKVTERLVEAGKIIGIGVLDHLIVGRPGYSSLKEKGWI